jgi:hypothetical protein
VDHPVHEILVLLHVTVDGKRAILAHGDSSFLGLAQ